MRNFKRIVSIGAAAMLAACGDSSGGGGGAPLVNIDYSGPLAAISIDSAANVGSIAIAANGSLSGFEGAGDASTVSGVAQAAPRVSGATVLSALRQLQGASAVGVTESNTQPCYVSGSVTSSATYADATGATVSQGDTFSTTFNSCDQGGV